jgi:hypothetical protein
MEEVDSLLDSIEGSGATTVLLGTKGDLEEDRVVSSEEAMQYAKSAGIPFSEIRLVLYVYNTHDCIVHSIVKIWNNWWQIW